VNSFAIADNCGSPQTLITGKTDAFVAGTRVSLLRVPCVLGDGSQSRIIIRVNNSVLALCEGDFAKGIAEAQTTIAKNKTNANSFEPVWDFDSDNQNQDAPSGDWWLSELVN